MSKLYLKTKGIRRAAFALAVAVAFVTTYIMVLPALTLDSGTAADEPGIRMADSGKFEEGDADSGSDSGFGEEGGFYESETGAPGSGEDSFPEAEAGASGSIEGDGKDSGNGEVSGTDSDERSGDGVSDKDLSEGITGDIDEKAAGNPAGNTAGNPARMNEENPGDNAPGDDESRTGTEQGSGLSDIDHYSGISNPELIAAGAGREDPADSSVSSSAADEDLEETQEVAKNDPGYEDSDLMELEYRVQDILLHVDTEEGVLQDGVNLKAEGLDSDDVLKAARDADIIDDEETEEKKGLKSKVRFGFTFSFRDAEDCRYDLPEEVTVRARRDADRTEEYLDEDHQSTPGQRLDDFLEIFQEYADGDREALKGWHMVILDGEDAEKAKELGYEEDALCLRTDRDLGFAVIYTEEDLMPAQSFEGELDDIRVSVEAPEGAFPRGTSMELSPVESKEVLEKIQTAVSSNPDFDS